MQLAPFLIFFLLRLLPARPPSTPISPPLLIR